MHFAKLNKPPLSIKPPPPQKCLKKISPSGGLIEDLQYTCQGIKQSGLLTPAMQSSDFVLSFIRLQAKLDFTEPYYAGL